MRNNWRIRQIFSFSLLYEGNVNILSVWVTVWYSNENFHSPGRKRKWFSVEEAVEELAKHKPVQSSYVSLLLPKAARDHTCPLSPSPCQPGIASSHIPSVILQERTGLMVEAERKEAAEREEVEEDGLEDGELIKMGGCSAEDLSNGSTPEDGANDT